MKIIIFGSNGQDGYYLSDFLKKRDLKVTNVSRNGSQILGNVSDKNFVNKIISEIKPNFIFHFAAKSSTQHQFIYENNETISLGTINILEAVRLYSPNSKVFLSGSAMQFQNKGLPIDENTPFEASSPYSISRIQSTYTARYYRDKFDLKIYIGYFFNHDSPLRTENHINQKIVRAVQRIKKGSKERLVIGNIYVEKEYNFADDFMQGVWHFVNQDDDFEVVFGSGISYPISKWLDICFSYVGLQWKDFVDFDSTFVSEYNRLVSNPSKVNLMGWSSKTSIEELAHIMLKN
jgi:GDPmannose 4,6-dehydratase